MSASWQLRWWRARIAWILAITAITCNVEPRRPVPPGLHREGAPPSHSTVPQPASAPALPQPPIRWLKGSTHVHARPSGDSSTSISEVIAWYQQRGYDFIVLTDHNLVSETAPENDSLGQVAVAAPPHGLIVLAGIELTHNPGSCVPAPPLPDGKCRIHVNALGVTARPRGKLEWAERRSVLRLDLYTRALVTARELGGLAQINHPQWHWGMTPELLIELARRGALLVEIANVQFASWNSGASSFLSTEALWDAVLAAGGTMWGIASDDAHSYDGTGKYPAGGAWVMVDAARDPRAIIAALAAGQFYSSTGVELARAGRDGEDLVVEVATPDRGGHRIAFIENGVTVETVQAAQARRRLPRRGTLRAVVWREDGARAWVQPARATAATSVAPAHSGT